MKDCNAIEVRNLKKTFKVYFDKSNSLKEKILFRNRNRYEERCVLDGISFDVKKGEAIGLIGHNGCGKSTTLKLLSKIIYPDSGKIEIRGRVSSLIELGAGFHPDMSGRENIYTNAAIFGLTKSEIEARIADIIEFSELHDYIDNPVRTYSSGMYMRLAFSVAINVDAEILLIDEILGVGDAHFQEKCFNKLKEIKRNGTTIVIVSHSLGQIEEICERSIWIDKGKIAMEGIPFDVHPKYMEYMDVEAKVNKTEEKEKEQKKKEEAAKEKYQSNNAKINKITIWNEKGQSQEIFHADEAARIEIEYGVGQYFDKAICGIDIKKDGWMRVYGTDLKTVPPSEFSQDIRESDYLCYLAEIADRSENLIDKMCVNGKCDKTDEAIVLHNGGNMWGPYLKAAPLHYKLFMETEFSEEQNVVLSVTAGSGAVTLGQFVLRPGKNRISIDLNESVENLEFVINNPEKKDIIIHKIIFS